MTADPGTPDAKPYDLSGPPGAPIIVFIHGTRVTRSMWPAVTARLADTYRCLCPDLPGHGALAGTTFSLDRAAGAVEDALDAEGIERAVVVGLSLGGYVAMAVAARSPERVRGLVLAGSTAEPTGAAAAAFRLFAWALGVAPKRPFDALNSWFFRRRYPPEIAEPIVSAGYWAQGGAAAVRTLPGTPFRERLLAYGGPILVINGDLDVVFRLGQRSFLRGVPRVSRRTLRWTTHLSPLDRPGPFAAAVRHFVERLPD